MVVGYEVAVTPNEIVALYKIHKPTPAWQPGEHSTEYERLRVLLRTIAEAAEKEPGWCLVLKRSGIIADDAFAWVSPDGRVFRVYDFIRSCGGPWPADSVIDRFEPIEIGHGDQRNAELAVVFIKPPRLSS